MQTSDNYNLKIYEGTDLFNPLTVENANTVEIDEIMKKNADAGTTTATELVTGAVHALTRSNPDCAVFRFTATSNYESGHTFTVDGVQVTALLTNGTQIPTGAYIIGSEVLCILKGTLLTIVASGASLALDSEKLNGHTADFYATQAGLTSTNELVTANGQAITTLNNKTNSIENSLENRGEWIELATTNNNGDLSVTDINTYRYLYIHLIEWSTGAIHGGNMIPVSIFKTYNSTSRAFGLSLYNLNRIYCYINYKTDTSLNVQVSANVGIKIYGIK